MDQFCQCPDVVKSLLETGERIYLINLNENVYVIKNNTEDVFVEYTLHNDAFYNNSNSFCSRKRRHKDEEIDAAVMIKKRRISTIGIHNQNDILRPSQKDRTIVCESSIPVKYNPHDMREDEYLVFVKKVMNNIRINCPRDETIIQRLLYKSFNKWTTIPLNILCSVIQQFVCKDLKNVMKKRVPKSKNTTKREQHMTKEFIKFLYTTD